jgi:hypothetical protein
VVERPALDLLRGHVGHRPDDQTFLGQRLGRGLSRAKGVTDRVELG